MAKKNFMIIAIGSKNQIKVQALTEILKDYPIFSEAKIVPIAVDSEVSEQPCSLKETILGAKNRAKNAFEQCDSCTYGFGMEGGLCEAPETQTGFLHFCVCSIYNGSNYHIGLSTGFEVPAQILSLILEKKMDLSQACFASKITSKQNIGAAEGLIGVLTRGRIDRKQYTKESIVSALVQLENPNWYDISILKL